MGGIGSGSYHHWWRPGRKAVVEECLSLDSSRLTREGIIKADAHQAGTWHWTYPSGKAFAVRYDLDTRDRAGPSVGLSYSWVRPASKEPQSADYRVGLTTTRPRYGGVRWWFVCPLTIGGRGCGRRVRKLYLPPRARYFGCRHCHDLSYRSVQTHDNRVSVLCRGPEVIETLLRGSPSVAKLALALKALTRLEREE